MLDDESPGGNREALDVVIVRRQEIQQGWPRPSSAWQMVSAVWRSLLAKLMNIFFVMIPPPLLCRS